MRDAAADPLAWLLQHALVLALRSRYRVELQAAPGFRLAPGTLLVCNHVRDSDGPLAALALCARGACVHGPLPHFAAREDLFRPGFLAAQLAHWPAPLPALLGRMPLGWALRRVHATPMRRVRELTLAEALALLPVPAAPHDDGAPLNGRGRRERAAARGGAWRARRRPPFGHAYWGLRRLARDARARLAPGFRDVVDAQLRALAAHLDAGQCVFLAAEGTTSAEGRFGRVRAGTWRVCALCASAPTIVPLALAYDALAPGRTRAVVRIGAPLRGLDPHAPAAFAAAIRAALRGVCTVTPSHLAARYLTRARGAFRTDDLARYLHAGAAALAERGVPLDRLLDCDDLAPLADARLRWLARHGLATRAAGRWHAGNVHDASPGWQRPADVVRYLANQLDDLDADAWSAAAARRTRTPPAARSGDLALVPATPR